MKQLLQSLKTGEIELLEISTPHVRANHLLIQTSRSVVCTGTERMLLEFGQASLIEKARKQPDKVKQVLQKIRTDGLISTLEAVKARIDEPLPLGYCNVGKVIEVGRRVDGFKIGDRVASSGPHAEIVCVPRNLCANIPDKVNSETAVFAVPGAIAIQGIRLLNPTLGECIVVTGLGLIGQLAVQLLISSGCKVLGIDIDINKVKLAEQFRAPGLVAASNVVEKAISFSQGRGVDGVLICASTQSNEPIEQAAEMCRKGGRIVLVGVVGLDIPRDLFYRKELSFQVSCSYGAGRYDQNYEEKGIDYPIGYVRWTAQRNFEAVLDMMGKGQIGVSPLISHRIPFKEAKKAYDILLRDNPLGIVLTYDEEVKKEREVRLKDFAGKAKPQKPVVGLIGAGNFTGHVLLPALEKTGARLKTIASRGGITGTRLGKKFGFERSVTDVKSILNDPEINTVFITTRHDTHASFVLEAIKSGKHVFVEKPLCLKQEKLHDIIQLYSKIQDSKASVPLVMVGFNRRFAPCTKKIQPLLSGRREPLCMSMTVNAGFISPDHWTQDLEIAGGRITGEACHFIDLLRFIANSPINSVQAVTTSGHTFTDSDKMAILFTFKDGSIGTVHYFSNGNKSYSKERLEIFCEEKIIVVDNFKTIRTYGFERGANLRLWRQDKGHKNEIREFLSAIGKGKDSPIPFEEIVEVSLATFAAVKSAEERKIINLVDLKQ